MKPVGFLSQVIIFATMTLGLIGCAVGPDFHTPAAPATSGYSAGGLPAATAAAGGGSQRFLSGADISGDWWSLFQSPELNSLIDAALAQNPTLAAAQQTLIEAEENVRAEQGNFLPSLSANFQAERERISSASSASFGGAADTVSPAPVSPATVPAPPLPAPAPAIPRSRRSRFSTRRSTFPIRRTSSAASGGPWKTLRQRRIISATS